MPQKELDFLRRWFEEECRPEHKARRKALILFSKKREYGKSTFARALVNEIEEYYIEIGGVSMAEQNFACKSKAKLFIVDDMEIDLGKYLEMWKKLLSSQRVNLRDCYFNQEFPGGIPVIVTTNSRKLFDKLANSSLFEDQCYFLSLSDFMGPRGCKPSNLTDSKATKREKYHCGKHCKEMAPIQSVPLQQSPPLSQENSGSRRFEEAVKKEEWSSCYKNCSEDEKQILLTKFAEIQSEFERLKNQYLFAPQINVFHIGPIINQTNPPPNKEEASYDKPQTTESDEMEGYPYGLEKKLKKYKQRLSDEVLSLEDSQMVIPGVNFDGQELKRTTPGIEFVSLHKLRRLLTWIKKKQNEDAQIMLHDIEESRERKSFALFHSYFLCCEKSDLTIQKGQELFSVKTCYFSAKRMNKSNYGALGRIYGAALQENKFKYSRRLSSSMQSFEKERRAYLCEDIYWDVDQVNSHPSLLISLLMHLKIDAPKLLVKYIEDREKLLGQIAESYETDSATAKNLMLRLIYGGTVNNWVTEHHLGLPSDEELEQQLIWFIHDLKLINEKLQKLPLFATALKIFQSTYAQTEITPTSFMSLLCGEYERQVLFYVKDWLALQTPNRYMDVLIHDGGLIRRLPEELEPPQDLLTALNQELSNHFETPYIRYSYKKFSNTLKDEIDQEEPFYF